jgi:hypothetical protein
MSRPALFGVALSVVVAAACAVPVSGSPVAAPPTAAETGRALPNPDRIAAADALGDPRTWDPCTVVDPPKVTGFGGAYFGVPRSLDYCTVDVSTDKGRAAVRIGRLEKFSVRHLADYRSVDRQGGLRVVHVGTRGGACVRVLVFDDGIGLSVDSEAEPPSQPVDTCGVADAVMEQVIDAVVHGRAGSFEYPAGSLGMVDACSLVTPEMVAHVPGLAKAKAAPQPSVSGHECVWARGQSRLVLSFVLGRPTSDVAEQFAGRETAFFSDDNEDKDYSVCQVTGVHIPFPNKVIPRHEQVLLLVFLPSGQSAAACDAARAVAAALWPKLPPPS